MSSLKNGPRMVGKCFALSGVKNLTAYLIHIVISARQTKRPIRSGVIMDVKFISKPVNSEYHPSEASSVSEPIRRLCLYHLPTGKIQPRRCTELNKAIDAVVHIDIYCVADPLCIAENGQTTNSTSLS